MKNTIEEIQDLKGLVKQILGTYPGVRDNDRMLLVKVWERQNHDLNNMFTNFRTFSVDFANGSYASPESIMRTRRLVQSKYPALRGRQYKRRKEILEPEVRNNINAIEV